MAILYLNLYMLDLSYSWLRFLLITVATIVPFLWVLKRPLPEKLYYLCFILFLWIYAGVGFGWEGCSQGYFLRYLVYMMTLGISCRYANPKKKNIKNPNGALNEELSKIVERYGRKVIFFYIFICLLSLAASGSISNLLHPPAADLSSLMGEVAEGKSLSGVQSLLYYIRSIVYIFYLISLYVYRRQLIKFSILLILPSYISFASSGYIGRGEMMMIAITIFILAFINYPQHRKKFVVGTIVAVPLVILFLFWYSMYRIGNVVDISSIKISDAVAMLSYQETSYPLHYVEVSKWSQDSHLSSSYLGWLVNLPLPGFLKLGHGDYAFNLIFSERLLGIYRGANGFYVKLPGIVNEGLFIFGPYLYFIHAVILGIIISKVFRSIRYDFELVLLIHLAFNVAFQLGRAGTTASGVFPFYFKHLLIYLLVRYYLERRIKQRLRKNSLKI